MRNIFWFKLLIFEELQYVLHYTQFVVTRLDALQQTAVEMSCYLTVNVVVVLIQHLK